jgi:RNA polymerase sigma-70 factor (sigma-E family)
MSVGGETLADLYREHRAGLARLAVLLVDDDAAAEDVVQEAFASLQAHRDDLREPDQALRYLRSSVLNASRSVLRRRQTARSKPVPPGAAPRTPESLALLDDEHRAVIVALGALPPSQREVLVLRYWSGLSEREIAEMTGLSPGGVKSAASRGLEALERDLGRAT